MRSLFYCCILFLQCILSRATAQEFPKREDEQKYQQYTKPSLDSFNKAYALWQHAKKGNWKDYNIDSLEQVSGAHFLNSRQRQIRFFKLYPDNYAGMYYFKRNFLDSYLYKPDSLSAIFSFFSAELKRTPLGKAVSAAIDKKMRLLIGNRMPPFVFKTATGEEVSLATFKGQNYVLLCFWDSWCAPCIRSIPLLRELHETYGPKDLQLIHVSIDREEQKWKESLARYPMPWLQTLDLPPYISDGSVKDLYDIHFIPQYFLLDKEGKLIYHNNQVEDDAGYLQLKKMLKQLIL